MPLFHIHGLIAGRARVRWPPAAASSARRASTRFNFFAWLDEAKPTWYTAVPTMHQAILSRARQATRRRSAPIRCASSARRPSSLPPQVIARTRSGVRRAGDRVLRHDRGGAPDGEQPAAARRAQARHRRAWRPAPRWRIMDEAGSLLPAGATGEIVIRGENVTAGYENNPKANAEAFANGWFRTGDQGVLDEDGYLTITGRLKEIINRGGEKISPREVDEVLMDHPAVRQVVTFAMPHEKLGEEVAAAVVLARRRRRHRARAPRFRRHAPRRLQGAAQDPLPRRDSQGRHRQAAAHRPRRKARADRRRRVTAPAQMGLDYPYSAWELPGTGDFLLISPQDLYTRYPARNDGHRCGAYSFGAPRDSTARLPGTLGAAPSRGGGECISWSWRTSRLSRWI